MTTQALTSKKYEKVFNSLCHIMDNNINNWNRFDDSEYIKNTKLFIIGGNQNETRKSKH